MASSGTVTRFVKRPDVGRAGQKIEATTNHYRLGKIPDILIYEYAIEICGHSGKPLKRRLSPKHAEEILDSVDVTNSLGNAKSTLIYDRRALAWSKDLISDFSVTIQSGTWENVQFSLKKATQFSLDIINEVMNQKADSSRAIPAITFLNHLFATRPTSIFDPIGRKFFSKQGVTSFRQLEFRRGIFQAVHFGGTQSLTLNIDMTTAVFWNSSCVTALNVAEKVLGKAREEISSSDSDQQRQLNRALKGLKFFVKHRGVEHQRRVYKIANVAKVNAREKTFETNIDGTPVTISVLDYMQRIYNRSLSCPDAPLIAGQPYRHTLKVFEAQEMIKVASGPPHRRRQDIADNKVVLNHRNDPMLNTYKIQVADQMVGVQGRILAGPKLGFAGVNYIGKEGKWAAPKNVKFKQGVRIKKWGVLSFTNKSEDRKIDQFIDKLRQIASDKGIVIENPRPVKIFENSNLDSDVLFKRLQKEMLPKFNQRGRIELLLVITSGNSSRKLYGPVKRCCDEEGYASQCVASTNACGRKGQTPDYAVNVLMKINAKLGGVNVSLIEVPPVLKVPTAFLGADVSHPPPGPRSNRPSLATMTGSLDSLGSRYAAVAANQGHRIEMIQDAEAMAKDLLIQFQKSTNRVPEQIIYLRDGVSEGQFAKVIETELSAIRKAATLVTNNKRVKIAVIIVKKRHHTRFFSSANQSQNRPLDHKPSFLNVRPGTVVDTAITHPIEYDFFLVSHQSFHGTCRPAHYHVICDEIGLKSDVLQQMLYHQCYSFARSQNSVSLHPAVYYAHLAGNRARVRDPVYDTDDTGSLVSEFESTVAPLTPIHSSMTGGPMSMWFV